MLKKVIQYTVTMLAAIMLVLSQMPLSSIATMLQETKNVSVDKEWLIHFNKPLAEDERLSEHIHVVNEAGERQQVLLTLHDEDSVKIYPPAGGYTPNTNYTIIIGSTLNDKSGKKLKSDVQKSFKTNSQPSSQSNTAFVPRPDAKNTIELVENFYTAEAEDVVTTDYDSGELLLKDEQQFKVGDFIALPATSQYTNGFVAKVTAVNIKNGQTIVQFTNAELKDYVKEFDFSQTIDVSAEDILANNALGEGAVASISPVAKRPDKIIEKAGNNGVQINLLDIKKKIEGEWENDDSDIEAAVKGNGTFTFNAKVLLEDIKINFDANWKEGMREFTFNAKETVHVNAKTEGNMNGNLKIPVAEIPIPYISASIKDAKIGFFVTIDLVVIIQANGEITYKLVQGIQTKTGIVDNKPFTDLERLEKDANDNQIANDLNASLFVSLEAQLPIGLAFRIFDDTLSSISFIPSALGLYSFNTSSANQFDDTTVKACQTIDINLHFGVRLFVEEIAFLDKIEKNFNVMKWPIYDHDSCKISSIELKAATTKMQPGATQQLNVYAALPKKQAKLKIPNSSITFKSSNEKIAKIDTNGKLVLDKNAKAGEKATITAVLTVGEQKLQDRLEFTVSQQSVQLGSLQEIIPYASYEIVNLTSDYANVKYTNSLRGVYSWSPFTHNAFVPRTKEMGFNYDEPLMQINGGNGYILTYVEKPIAPPVPTEGSVGKVQISTLDEHPVKLYIVEPNDIVSVELLNVQDPFLKHVSLTAMTDKLATVRIKTQDFNSKSQLVDIYYNGEFGDVNLEYFDSERIHVYEKATIMNTSQQPMMLWVPTKGITFDVKKLDVAAEDAFDGFK